MTSRAQFVRQIAGRDRKFVVLHDALRDRLRVLCDDEPIDTKVIRKPFSSLFRYPFAVDGEALEVRVRSGMLEPIFELVEASAPIERTKLGWPMYGIIALMCIAMVMGVKVSVAPDMPMTFLAGLAVVSALVTSGLIHLVYERRSA